MLFLYCLIKFCSAPPHYLLVERFSVRGLLPYAVLLLQLFPFLSELFLPPPVKCLFLGCSVLVPLQSLHGSFLLVLTKLNGSLFAVMKTLFCIFQQSRFSKCLQMKFSDLSAIYLFSNIFFSLIAPVFPIFACFHHPTVKFCVSILLSFNDHIWYNPAFLWFHSLNNKWHF